MNQAGKGYKGYFIQYNIQYLDQNDRKIMIYIDINIVNYVLKE